MSEHEIRHPLKRWRFYAECLRYATTGTLGVIGDWATGLPSAGLLFKLLAPAKFAIAAAWLKAHGLGEELFLEVPLTIGGLILLGRLITAPFIFYRDKSHSALARDDESLRDRTLRLAAEIGQFAAIQLNAQPPRRIIRTTRSMFEDVPASELAYSAHVRETALYYSSHFLERVNGIREELSLIPIVDAELDRANINPTLLENTQTISNRLKAIGNLLPDNPISDAVSLRLALERAAPRHLTDDARRIITEYLRPLIEQERARGAQPQIAVHYKDCSDCAEYALDFEKLFTSLGFQLVPSGMKEWLSDIDGVREDYRVGVYIRHDPAYATKRGIPMFGDALHAALTEAHIAAEKLDRPGINVAELVIGARPRSLEQ